MGWDIRGHAPQSPKAYFNAKFTYSNPERNTSSRVLASALIARCEYYAAVEQTVNDLREVYAAVVLIESPNGEFAYKMMDESVGPCAYRCPASILALLTPTKHPHAIAWRAKNQERLVTRKNAKAIQHGTCVKFAEPIYFNNGQTRDTFVVEKVGKKTRFRSAGGTVYRITKWQERPFTIIPTPE